MYKIMRLNLELEKFIFLQMQKLFANLKVGFVLSQKNVKCVLQLLKVVTILNKPQNTRRLLAYVFKMVI